MIKTHIRYVTVFLMLLAILCSLPLLPPAQAAGQQYTVTYDANGGNNAPAAQTQNTGTALVLSSTSPSRSYHIFKGWATTPYGTVVYQPGDNYTAGTDITLYAVWFEDCPDCKAGYRTTTCSKCIGNGYYVICLSNCHDYSVSETIGQYGTMFYQCQYCWQICGVYKKRIDCPTTQKIQCSSCYGIGYQKTTPPAAPKPEFLSSTRNSITVAAQTGMQYSIDGLQWQNSNTFTGLQPRTSYTIYQRYAGNNYYFAGKTSPGLTVSTQKDTASTPPAPTLSVAYHDTVVLAHTSGCEYSMDGITWQSNERFEGLKPATTYTFYQRKYETGTLYASEASAGLTVRTTGFGSLVMDSASGTPGDTVTMNLKMPANPHLTYLTIELSYHPAQLELIGITDSEILAGFDFSGYNGYVTLLWDDSTAITNNTQIGTIATLTFKITDSAREGDTSVSIEYVYSTDKDNNVNGFSVTSGTVTVSCKSHHFGKYYSNAVMHYRVCSTCNYKLMEHHEYDHACDTECNVCGYPRLTKHDYILNKNETGHWYECSACKDQSPTECHVPGPEATEDTAQTCTICGYVIQPAFNHEHSYETIWTANNQGHWHSCPGCEEKSDFAEHRFENACSTNCSDCGYTREVGHNYVPMWTSSSETHWHACTFCGMKSNEAPHEPGPEATETEAQICTVCGYELVAAHGSGGTAPGDTTSAGQDPSGKNDTLLWIKIAVVLIVISGVAGGCIVLAVIKKKKK